MITIVLLTCSSNCGVGETKQQIDASQNHVFFYQSGVASPNLCGAVWV